VARRKPNGTEPQSPAAAAPHAPTRPSGLSRIRLRKNLAKAIHGGQPWLFRDALEPGIELPDGAIVLITTSDGRALGRGFWSRTSPIAVRMLTTAATDVLTELVRSRLGAALARRLEFLDRARTNAFRWVNGEADLLPGMHLDVYAHVGAVRFDGPGARAFYRDLAPIILEVGAPLDLSTLVERHRGARTGVAPDGGAPAPEVVLAGALPHDELEVLENGVRFGVDVVRGQKGGLFLDQRDNRARVRALARDRRVLNLFGYTGGFSSYAALGGARATTTVDVAAGAIASARRNFTRNGLSLDAHELVVADVFAFLAEAARARRVWDVVISDPPSFAPNRRSLPAAVNAYRRLHRMCAAVIAPGGTFCAASCSSHVDEATFLRTVDEGVNDAGRHFALTEVHGAGPDHPVASFFPEGRYLKFAIGTVTSRG
jgi:23S rRNA (cytosine1962-C5)-methyltransferase